MQPAGLSTRAEPSRLWRKIEKNLTFQMVPVDAPKTL